MDSGPNFLLCRFLRYISHTSLMCGFFLLKRVDRMKVTEAFRLLLLYAMNQSKCGKLPKEEHQASLIIKSFFKELKEIDDSKLREIINEQL